MKEFMLGLLLIMHLALLEVILWIQLGLLNLVVLLLRYKFIVFDYLIFQNLTFRIQIIFTVKFI